MKFNLELSSNNPSALLLQKYPDSQFINILNGVVFIYTRNPALIQKFINLRSELYDKDSKFVGFRDFQHNDITDYSGKHHIIQVLMEEEKCIGGSMLTLVMPGEEHLLPLEIDLGGGAYLLKKMYPELKLETNGYVEVSRMFIHPDYRKTTEYVANMFINSYNQMIKLGARYKFAMTDNLRCRMYRRIGWLYVHKNTMELPPISLPKVKDFEGVKMQIMGWDDKQTAYNIAKNQLNLGL